MQQYAQLVVHTELLHFCWFVLFRSTFSGSYCIVALFAVHTVLLHFWWLLLHSCTFDGWRCTVALLMVHTVPWWKTSSFAQTSNFLRLLWLMVSSCRTHCQKNPFPVENKLWSCLLAFWKVFESHLEHLLELVRIHVRHIFVCWWQKIVVFFQFCLLTTLPNRHFATKFMARY